MLVSKENQVLTLCMDEEKKNDFSVWKNNEHQVTTTFKMFSNQKKNENIYENYGWKKRWDLQFFFLVVEHHLETK